MLPAPARTGGLATTPEDFGPGLLLHALRVTMPCGRVFSCLPPWEGEFALRRLPDPIDAAGLQTPDAGFGAFPLKEEHAIEVCSSQ